jgi:hypothetical protein
MKMATYNHTCEQCGKQLLVPDRYLGRGLKCPHCGQGFRVAPQQEVPPEPPSPPPALPGIPSEPFGPAPTAPLIEPESAPPLQFSTEASVHFAVKRIDVLSAAKVTAALHGILGLLMGLAIALMLLLVPMPLSARGLFSLGKGIIVVLALVAVPGTYLVIGFVSGALLAALYNLAAGIVGPIRVELE